MSLALKLVFALSISFALRLVFALSISFALKLVFALSLSHALNTAVILVPKLRLGTFFLKIATSLQSRRIENSSRTNNSLQYRWGMRAWTAMTEENSMYIFSH